MSSKDKQTTELLNTITIKKMKELLKTNKLSTTGNRNDLLIRLQEARILPLYPNINDEVPINRNELYKTKNRDYVPTLILRRDIDKDNTLEDYLSPQEKIQRKQQGKKWGFKSKGNINGLPLPQYIRPTEIKEIKPIQINKITPSSRKIMLEEPELQYISENHINTSPKNIYNMESNNEPTVEKKQRKPRQPRQPRKHWTRLSLEEKEINRLLKKMEKVRDEINKKYSRLENLKTVNAKQNKFDDIKRRFTELKNVYGILIEYGLEDDYRVKNMEGEIRHYEEMNFMTDKYLKEIKPIPKEPKNPKAPKAPKEPKEPKPKKQPSSSSVGAKPKKQPKKKQSLNIYNQYINALLFVAGYDLNTGNDDDIRMMSYYLEQVFPEIIKYNVYNIKKSQATKILEDIRKYIEDTDNDTHFKILESLDTTNVTKTLPNEKKQSLLPTLDDKPKKKYNIPTDLHVINIDEHVPSIIPKDKEITIKQKPKTPKPTTPVKKKRSYKDATFNTYIKNGYEYTIITYKDGEVFEKKRKLTQEEIDNLPVEKPHIYLTELDKYLNKISNYDTSELKQELTDNGIKIPSGKNDIELIDILKKLYIRLHKDTYDKHILI